MGIQIVSAMAEHDFALESLFVEERSSYFNRKHEIVSPDTNRELAKYVEEVILRWSAGRILHCPPPTWRRLLTVLQAIGLIQLSQQIQEFIKGMIVTWDINLLVII